MCVTVYFFFSLCLSLSTTFPPEKRSIKRSTTFTSERNFFSPPLPIFISVSDMRSSLLFCVCLHHGAFFGMNRLFDLSVLVEFQSHARLCSEQLQIFPVYFFLCNLCHSCVCKIQYISLFAFLGEAPFILITERQIGDLLWTIGMLLRVFFF